MIRVGFHEALESAENALLAEGGLVRQQLLQSGLSPTEIRARLRAMGIPADALDDFQMVLETQDERRIRHAFKEFSEFLDQLED